MTGAPDTLAEETVLAGIAAAIAEESGWAAHLLPQRALRRAVARRMAATDLTAPAAYLLHLRSRPDERTALLGEVLIHETSFFRDMAVFDHLLTWCLERLRTHGGMLRILSAPCSTGEEAYSVAAQLWRAGVPLERFHIDAVDIAPDAVAAVARAQYRGLSLRSVPHPEQEPFLQPADGGWQVVGALRGRVSARVGNLVTPDALPLAEGAPPYDLILSRNLLMYLHPGARGGLIRNLHEALAPDGRLVLGSADWAPDLAGCFAPEHPFVSFAARPLARVAASQADVCHGRGDGGSPPKPRRPAAAPPRSPDGAATLYREALRARRTGLPHEAVRKSRQALYLEPTHVPAMELLYQVWEQAPARVRRALAERLQRHQSLKGENA